MPFDYLMAWLPFTQIDRTMFPPEHHYFLAEYDKTLKYRYVYISKEMNLKHVFFSRRFEPLFDTLRGNSREFYFTPAQRSRLVYDCLLRTPFDMTIESETEEQQG